MSRTWLTSAAVVMGVLVLVVWIWDGGRSAFSLAGWLALPWAVLGMRWRLERRVAALRTVCHAFFEQRYDARAVVGIDRLSDFATELNRLGEQLQHQQRSAEAVSALLEGALGSLDEGVVCIDPLDRVLYANPAWRRLVGPAAIGAVWYAHLADPRVAIAVNEARSGSAPSAVELTRAHAQLRVRAASAGEGVVALVIYDLTVQRSLELRRRDFMTAVSHELKTPLTSILGFTETVLGDATMAAPEIRNCIERIAHHSDRLSSLVHDVLTLSRLEEGAWQPRPVELELGALGRELIAEASDAGASRRISCQLDAAAPLHLRHDPALLRLLIGNLLANAVRYNRVEGKVYLRLRGDAQEVVVEVEDTGSGIPPEHQSRIFERFYRVDEHRSRQTGGTGLGLSIVKHLLPLVGGSVGLRSSLAGSCFTLRLPRAQP